MLSSQQQRNYQRDGFLVLENFATHADCDALVARTAELVAEFEPPERKSIFSTIKQEQ